MDYRKVKKFFKKHQNKLKFAGKVASRVATAYLVAKLADEAYESGIRAGMQRAYKEKMAGTFIKDLRNRTTELNAKKVGPNHYTTEDINDAFERFLLEAKIPKEFMEPLRGHSYTVNVAYSGEHYFAKDIMDKNHHDNLIEKAAGQECNGSGMGPEGRDITFDARNMNRAIKIKKRIDNAKIPGVTTEIKMYKMNESYLENIKEGYVSQNKDLYPEINSRKREDSSQITEKRFPIGTMRLLSKSMEKMAPLGEEAAPRDEVSSTFPFHSSGTLLERGVGVGPDYFSMRTGGAYASTGLKTEEDENPEEMKEKKKRKLINIRKLCKRNK